MADKSPTLEEQLAAARELMNRYDATFSVLAKGDDSLYMTEDFRGRLTEAEKRLEKYKIRSSQTHT